MDYESIHGVGESNFSSPLSHRMPTVSAAQALYAPSRCISTSLPGLDSALQNREVATVVDDILPGGFSRGKVTEIYGPPGVGKTALGLQLAVTALRAQDRVHWVDAAHPLSGTRLFQALNSSPGSQLSENEENKIQQLEKFTHFHVPSLAHFLALLASPLSNFANDHISLLVIDSFSTLISAAFPRSHNGSNTPKKPGAPNPSSRRFPILQYIINALQKLAATQNVAIVIISQCVTKMRPGAGAVLVPAINTTAWEQGLGGRVALYRDWGWDNDEGNGVDCVRFAHVLKAEGVDLSNGRSQPVAFTIKEGCLEELTPPTQYTSEPTQHANVVQRVMNSTSILPLKRKLDVTELEIPDSDVEDDEDYGWAEDDEQELPAPPPQWQGSEDILITRTDYLDEDGEDEDEDNELPPEAPTFTKASTKARKEQVEIDDSEDELAL